MSSNKSAKQKLIQLYGAECFIDKLGLRKFDKPVHYTSKGQYKRMKQLTYHHIRMKKDGGKATVENGAILSAENHTWFHQQSPILQKKMNEMFQEYKKCRIDIVNIDEIPEPEFEVDLAEIDVKKELIVKPFSRAKIKEETRKAIDEYYQSLED